MLNCTEDLKPAKGRLSSATLPVQDTTIQIDQVGRLSEVSAERERRLKGIKLAWGSSLISKVITFGTQALVIPLAYRALGETGFAAYAAVTASASLIGALNLGIGGSLVTPIAESAAKGDERRQAMLLQAGLAPLALLCLIGAMVTIPAAALLPLSRLFGKVGANGGWDLRVAALIAVSATLIAIPLSAIDVLRQAYQEMHISNLTGAASNLLLCVALVVAAKHSKAVAVFVAVFTLVPLLGRFVNCGLLLSRRRYLIQGFDRFSVQVCCFLLDDGIRDLASSFSFVLVYQWPVYWIARTLPASDSAVFAICTQVVLLPISFVVGFVQPLWSSTADAAIRGDHAWLDGQLRKGRAAIGLVGGSVFLTMLLFGEQILRTWLRRPIMLDWHLRALLGAYVLLAMWEYFHFTLSLGVGRLKEGTMAVFQRSACFALSVPLLTVLGGVQALWCGMCASVLLWTAWRLPRIGRMRLQRETDGPAI